MSLVPTRTEPQVRMGLNARLNEAVRAAVYSLAPGQRWNDLKNTCMGQAIKNNE